MKENNKYTNTQMFIYLIIYKTVIEFMYIYAIAPIYNYSGLTLNINKIAYVVSVIFLLLIVIFSPKNKTRPSTYLYFIMEIFLIVPTLAYYWLNNQSVVYTFFVVFSSIIISHVLKIKPVNFNIKSRTANIWVSMFFVFYVITTVYLIIKRGGIDARALNFDLIYDMRAENELNGIWGYLMNWSTKALCPFFFAYFYLRKKYLFIIPILALQLMMYLSFGNKAFLFSIGVIIMSVIITKRNKFVREMVFAISGLNIIAYVLDFYGISDVLRRSIPYRLTFIPAQIQFQYYEFFRTSKKMHFADGAIGKILNIDSPFQQKVSFIIGSYFSHNGLGTNANTGMLADAYANGGVILMIFIAIFFGIILNIIDSATNKLPVYVVVGSFSYIMFVLNDTALLTTLLTGGMGLMILLLLLFNSSIE
ncbi:hypothetical protein [Clostridium sp. UBA4548]|uniref:hypothetical protein n=1 Tax=Clostridium sp. UBA4548 TaxID=1946361 RepID=UPI0025B9FEA4|nr:hypothetical protein [Clostridium sp. UBA4548]